MCLFAMVCDCHVQVLAPEGGLPDRLADLDLSSDDTSEDELLLNQTLEEARPAGVAQEVRAQLCCVERHYHFSCFELQ